MKTKDLIDSLKANYYMVFEPREIEKENDITSYRIPVFTKKEDVLIRQWVQYYVDAKDNAFWSDRNPLTVTNELTIEQVKEQELSKIKAKAIETKGLVDIGLVPQSEFDTIKVEYDSLK